MCGDLDAPVTVCVPDPNKWALADLKVEVSKKVDQPVDEISLYCGEAKVLEGVPLMECDGMRNGVALY